jgi:hypothetical protein
MVPWATHRARGPSTEIGDAISFDVQRDVVPELLDALPIDDRRAVQARRDLRKINACMGHSRIMARALARAFRDEPPRSITDIGAGDGTGLLRLARRLPGWWRPVHALLVDRQQLLSTSTRSALRALSWHVESVQMDVFEWLQRPNASTRDVTVATLFLHHFPDDDLAKLLQQASQQTDCFLACEPRRDDRSLAAARLLRLLGCNDVTRHDARVSVRAGFRTSELSELWPRDSAWRVTEEPTGWFTHCFMAQRVRRPNA